MTDTKHEQDKRSN